ncbi:glucosamine-6-phosphate deaminase [Candidatus Symbiothrix dinenymphae]|uniref:glucosamine-6-phosphate deaminase n=1 Tax=Candidatus Symbiothrix dinenymphae TaxID=467085 RepID=UPI0006C3AED0|nr:glucosamine-6-phosphate deaminase [Candidatus Symbiothrix dinenymphae]GAP72572.1 glucosamine-6-phosphate deaminase [Candidatus Symbiothrix dinenymphae]
MENLDKRYEKVPVSIFTDADVASDLVAKQVATLIREKQVAKQKCVLGLVGGSSVVGVYERLVELHKKEGLSFKNVVVFNESEYYPLAKDELQSHYLYLYEYLFHEVDILPENIHLIPGNLKKEEISAFCEKYEKLLKEAGGIDLQLISADGRGQLAANEPGSMFTSRTHLVTLDYSTRMGAASNFFGEENVPNHCITIGLGTIMDAKRIIFMAWGEGKAKVIRKIVEEGMTEMLPASILQKHPNASFIFDEASAAELTRIKTPWLVGTVKWTDRAIRKAVFWLCEKLEKPILKLTERDYNDSGLGELVSEFGPANKINIRVFNDLQHTITGWPGGKPNADDSTRPERATPFPKRVVVFSPHPDDDVISMGGTLARLSEHGHEVHLAYETSGNIAVFDDEVTRFLDFVRGIAPLYKFDDKTAQEAYQQSLDFFKQKRPGQPDIKQVAACKTAIRQGEARSACRYLGIPENRVHFLNLPFYETGTVKKAPITKADVDIIVKLLQEVKPQQIFAAGDLSDPHGTHRVCFIAILEALKQLQGETWLKDCYMWLYRGAWQEWDIAEVDMAVPLSPEESRIKRMAIYKHQSQKDPALFPGTDQREFWKRAEDRNKNTAARYDQLGMAEYQAMELFVRHHFEKK